MRFRWIVDHSEILVDSRPDCEVHPAKRIPPHAGCNCSVVEKVAKMAKKDCPKLKAIIYSRNYTKADEPSLPDTIAGIKVEGVHPLLKQSLFWNNYLKF